MTDGNAGTPAETIRPGQYAEEEQTACKIRHCSQDGPDTLTASSCVWPLGSTLHPATLPCIMLYMTAGQQGCFCRTRGGGRVICGLSTLSDAPLWRQAGRETSPCKPCRRSRAPKAVPAAAPRWAPGWVARCAARQWPDRKIVRKVRKVCQVCRTQLLNMAPTSQTGAATCSGCSDAQRHATVRRFMTDVPFQAAIHMHHVTPCAEH